ncbi:MAG TPA: class I SAM-dependent methyltransferase [Phycisphaerae bacterium]|nr:class I SAM-dependent methyltransferase [Phycisphaerae bacterium]
MALKPPTIYSPAVRRTMHWLIPRCWLDQPHEARGEVQYLLCHAQRLHDSLIQLPSASDANRRCLVVGSWGIEAPYLIERLGWTDVTCVCAPHAPASKDTEFKRTLRQHPNADCSFEFDLLERDLEAGSLPFDDGEFGLVVFWGCFEHLRYDPEGVLYEINRVTAPNGVMSLVTDNAISFQMTHSLLRGRPMPMRLHEPAPEGHWRLYAPAEIEELLRGTGWNVELLTSIVADPPVYWQWWKRWLFRRLVAGYRRGFGLPEPYWNAFILAHASKVAAPSRRYPGWLYKDEKIRALKREMLDVVTNRLQPAGT